MAEFLVQEIIRKKQDENTARYADMLAKQTMNEENSGGTDEEQGVE